MEGKRLSPEQAYDLLTSWTQILLDKAKRRSLAPRDVNDMVTILSEVATAVGHVETAVRRWN
jgi:hypothetical protein